MTLLPPASDIEHGVACLPRTHLALHGLLMQGPVWLDRVFDDPSLAKLGLVPGRGKVDFRWCLRAVGRSGTLLQLGLPPALFEALALPQHLRATVRSALAQQWAAPILPALRGFFEQDFEWRVDEAPDGWPETGGSVAFQLSVPDLCLLLQGRLADAFVPTLRDLLDRCMGPRRGDVPMRLFAGTRLRLQMSEALRLQEGDVLLCDDGPPGAARQVRLFADSVSGFSESHCLATVRVQDGRVEELAPGPWVEGEGDAPRGPMVTVDVVEAWLSSSSARCRRLSIGRCVDEWQSASWLDLPQLRIGGRPWARVRPARVAGHPGHEIVTLSTI